MLEWKGVDDRSVLILGIDSKPQVEDSVANIADHQVPRRRQHGIPQAGEIMEILALGIEEFVRTVATMHEIPGQATLPEKGGSAVGLSAVRAKSPDDV